MALMFVSSSAPMAQDEPSGALIETSALQAIIVDGETGAVLFEKDADQTFPPASLAKLMTMELVFKALAEGTITPRTEYPVSEFSWRTGGAPSGTSTMFAEVRSSVPVDALMQGVIVQAANDAAIILAEGMEGTEAPFAQAMNIRAAELGLTSSRFVNATGLPAEGQVVTVRDLAKLARHIEATYPQQYRLYAQPEFEWNEILQRNRNPLLRLDIGATGMATGFTEASGYSLVGVTDQEGQKLFIALGGLESEAARAEESGRLLAWASEAFDRRTLFSAGETIGSALVYGGTRSEVPLVTDRELAAHVPKEAPESVKAVLIYDGPLRAPVAKGDRVGRIEVQLDGRTSVSHDLFAADDVPQGNFSSRAIGAVQELAFGWIRAL